MMNGHTRGRLIAVIVAASALVPALSGCLVVDPGGQVGRALGQTLQFGWDAEGNFSTEGAGAQTQRFKLAEGHLVGQPNEAGELVIDWEKSRLTHYLEVDPSAEQAATAMDAALAASIAQSQNMTDIVNNLVTTVLPLMTAPRGALDSGVSEPGPRDRILEEILRRLPPPPPVTERHEP